MATRNEMSNQGRIPEAIYKILPYFYLSVGVLTILLANNFMAIISGISLISAGIIVWTLRYQYRKERQIYRKQPVEAEKDYEY
jgi:multisubunit Na+/H+ antiporter MnhC subunit